MSLKRFPCGSIGSKLMLPLFSNSATNDSSEFMGSAMLIELLEENEACILRCRGRLVPGANQDYLAGKLKEFGAWSTKKVVVDFSEVSCIGWAGISFLIGVYSSVRNLPGGCFVIVGVNRRVREVLDLTGLSTLIHFADDLNSGLAALGEQPPRSSRLTVA